MLLEASHKEAFVQLQQQATEQSSSQQHRSSHSSSGGAAAASAAVSGPLIKALRADLSQQQQQAGHALELARLAADWRRRRPTSGSRSRS
jgi:hypothetical protein